MNRKAAFYQASAPRKGSTGTCSKRKSVTIYDLFVPARHPISERKTMRVISCLVIVFCLLLSGCATRIRSEVTAFHQWPAAAAEKSFAFDHKEGEPVGLERQSYENLIRTELLRVGLREAASPQDAALKVNFDAHVTARDVRVIETVVVDSWYGTPWYGPGFYSPYWGGWPGYYHPSPFYGPFGPGMPVAREQERRYTVFHRELKLKISDTLSSQPLYEVTVRSEGKEGNLAKLMPYLVRSAFTDFPGKSGVPRVIDMKLDPKT